jgi:hypothetical protein
VELPGIATGPPELGQYRAVHLSALANGSAVTHASGRYVDTVNTGAGDEKGLSP